MKLYLLQEMSNVKKKVTKIIRKDEILYRPAGGSACLPEESDVFKNQESPGSYLTKPLVAFEFTSFNEGEG